jgi:transposase
MIKVEAVWLAVQPLDMRAGTESALARVVAVFGAARPHHAYLFANRRANRMKVLVHDGIGVWRHGGSTAASSSGPRMLAAP